MTQSFDRWLPWVLLGLALLFWIGLMTAALYQAALPANAKGAMVAVFPPRTPPAKIFSAVVAADGRLVNSTWLGFAWVVQSEHQGFVDRLRQQGAYAAFRPDVFQPITTAGCYLSVPIATR